MDGLRAPERDWGQGQILLTLEKPHLQEKIAAQSIERVLGMQ